MLQGDCFENIFVTDLHGSERKYECLFEVAKEFKSNIIINGGDMLPKSGDLFCQKEVICMNMWMGQWTGIEVGNQSTRLDW